jgi:hypothetical protein
MGLKVGAAAPVKPPTVLLGPVGVLVGLPPLPGAEVVVWKVPLFGGGGGGEEPVPVLEGGQ